MSASTLTSSHSCERHGGRAITGGGKNLALLDFSSVQTDAVNGIATMFLSCTVSWIFSLIFQNLKRSRDPEHIPFGGNLSLMH